MGAVYDIAVIGGGPAGATFARLAAGCGKIIMFDGDTPCGKPCGGLLAPDAQRVLAGFGLTLPGDILADPQIFAVKTVDIPKRVVRYYPRMYLNMDRHKFDRWLMSLIPESVNVVNARAVSVKRLKKGFEVEYRQNGEIQKIRCRTVVGADGANSIVRRSLFGEDDIMHYVAIQQWFRNDSGTDPFYSCIFDPETSESCSWSINKDDHIIYGGSFSPKGCRDSFERQKKRFEKALGIRLGEPVRTEACKVFRPRKMGDFKTYSKGAFLIGEAAGFISPSSFEGISSAMKSGKALAEAFAGKKNIGMRYDAAVAEIKLRMYLKCFKRIFMYEPVLREWVMRSGITSISVMEKENHKW